MMINFGKAILPKFLLLQTSYDFNDYPTKRSFCPIAAPKGYAAQQENQLTEL